METFLVIWPFSQNDILPIAGFLGVPLAVFILSYKYKLIEKITKKNSFKKTQKHKPMENTVSKTPTLKSVCFELKSIWKRTLLAKYFAKIITETKEYKSPEKKVVSAAQQVDAVITDGETTKTSLCLNVLQNGL